MKQHCRTHIPKVDCRRYHCEMEIGKRGKVDKQVSRERIVGQKRGVSGWEVRSEWAGGGTERARRKKWFHQTHWHKKVSCDTYREVSGLKQRTLDGRLGGLVVGGVFLQLAESLRRQFLILIHIPLLAEVIVVFLQSKVGLKKLTNAKNVVLDV